MNEIVDLRSRRTLDIIEQMLARQVREGRITQPYSEFLLARSEYLKSLQRWCETQPALHDVVEELRGTDRTSRNITTLIIQGALPIGPTPD